MSKPVLILALVAGVSCTAACDKGEKSETTSSSSEPSAKPTKKDEKGAASAESKTGDACSGAYADANGAYCIKLPAGFELDKSRSNKTGDKQMDFFTKKGMTDIVVSYWPKNDKDLKLWPALIGAEGDDSNVVKEHADVDGGKGKYKMVDHPLLKAHDETAYDVGKDMMGTCVATWRQDTPGSEVVAGVCKTLIIR